MDWISLPRRTASFTAIGHFRVSQTVSFSAAPPREMAAPHALGIARAPAPVAGSPSLLQQMP